MKRLLAPLFKTSSSRGLTALLSACLMVGASRWVVWYLDERCATPALGFATIMGWLCLLAALAWVLVMALSPALIVPSVLAQWAKGSWGQADLPLELPELDEFDPRHYQVNPQVRFKVLYGVAVLLPTLGVHLGFDSFLTRFQREGTARIALRSELREERLWGLSQLSHEALSGRVTHSSPQLNAALLKMLSDPDPEVSVQVAGVIGALNVTSASEALAALALKGEASRELRAASLLALAQLKTSRLDDNPAHEALKRLSASPEVRSSAPYELAIALGLQRLPTPEALKAIYSLASGVGGEVKTREAAVWALGELRDPELIPALSLALRDEALSVRCLAAFGLEKLAAFESSEPLRAAWPSAQKSERCPLIESPKGAGLRVEMMPQWDFQLVLIRALASTDDPSLLTWLVEHQHEVAPLTHRLMNKAYDALKNRDERGLLEDFKRRNLRQAHLNKRPSAHPSEEPSPKTPTTPPTRGEP